MVRALCRTAAVDGMWEDKTVLETIEAPNQILALASQGTNIYLLLETEMLEDHLREQPDVPDSASLYDEVKKLDFACTARWIWAETAYASVKERGPLLLQVSSDSPALERFSTLWSKHDGGVLFTSVAAIEDIESHLRSLLFVYLDDGAKARFRLQEVEALQSLLQSLDHERRQLLLGPFDRLIWRENLGIAWQWWTCQGSGKPELARKDASVWFRFQPHELVAIDTGVADLFLRAQTTHTAKELQCAAADARIQTRYWLKLAKEWGFETRQEKTALLDLLRRPGFSDHENPLFALLEGNALRPGARLTRAYDYLENQGT